MSNFNLVTDARLSQALTAATTVVVQQPLMVGGLYKLS